MNFKMLILNEIQLNWQLQQRDFNCQRKQI